MVWTSVWSHSPQPCLPLRPAASAHGETYLPVFGTFSEPSLCVDLWFIPDIGPVI